ncbi:Gas vesicle synthesis protein GvpO [Streptomyces sp. 2224.1]|uniref:gas vesicle protein GvpO n=1 Tax=unclassified Streptomyces TaxID=2593676 RepID=UPI000880ABAD|nr:MULTISPECIES: gas vesicle protein [unclassified Streptomyces]PBC80644.1 gas vesicle protein GvpO [Streptomyces sp. 2321.6]SDR57802.1 Gas vesicle synthesis protein GvpO [Streptomyces sp. KS_16]SEB82899.1 Gas vesicle synthesis protein GvpO [Streptomyces sp. 2133.1]SED42399.1 Gas vesicle synthesis protein GvpO [Streptomyces sp. 2224.1]SEF13662.1 Gas vesicle synthesis protein GvpO [Streptomyces sp. 2112.3]
MAEQSRTRVRSSTAARKHKKATGNDPGAVARRAAELLQSLISQRVEGVSAVRRTDDGWCVEVDVLELARIPDTTSLLATYDVKLDDEGELLEYYRTHRYRRGAADQ